MHHTHRLLDPHAYGWYYRGMGDQSAISWTDATWNPVTGCSHVSPGCDHCYAEALSLRYGWSKLPWTPENAEENVILHPDRLDRPARWRKPRMIFVNSMSDLFHPKVPGEFINEVWMAMYNHPRHTYQAHASGWPVDEIWPDWMWVGTSIESREYVDRADMLRETPAAVRFISAEPLLGPLLYDGEIGTGAHYATGGMPDDMQIVGSTEIMEPGWIDGYEGDELDLTDIDWLIVGGESGPAHRPMQMEWVSALREACWDGSEFCFGERVRGTAFFFKQDCGARAGQRGRFSDEVKWPQEMPVRSSE